MPSQATQFEGLPEAVPDALVGMVRSGQIHSPNRLADPLTMRHRSRDEAACTEILHNASLYRDTDGNVLGVLATAHDVTRQLSARNQVAEEQARELEPPAERRRLQRLTVGRELTMIELREKITYLRKHDPAGGGAR